MILFTALLFLTILAKILIQVYTDINRSIIMSSSMRYLVAAGLLLQALASLHGADGVQKQKIGTQKKESGKKNGYVARTGSWLWSHKGKIIVGAALWSLPNFRYGVYFAVTGVKRDVKDLVMNTKYSEDQFASRKMILQANINGLKEVGGWIAATKVGAPVVAFAAACAGKVNLGVNKWKTWSVACIEARDAVCDTDYWRVNKSGSLYVKAVPGSERCRKFLEGFTYYPEFSADSASALASGESDSWPSSSASRSHDALAPVTGDHMPQDAGGPAVASAWPSDGYPALAAPSPFVSPGGGRAAVLRPPTPARFASPGYQLGGRGGASAHASHAVGHSSPSPLAPSDWGRGSASIGVASPAPHGAYGSPVSLLASPRSGGDSVVDGGSTST
jgi:hypothetical protein